MFEIFDYSTNKIKVICWVNYIACIIAGLITGLTFDDGIFFIIIGSLAGVIVGWIQGILLNCVAEIIDNLISIHKKLYDIEEQIKKSNETTNS